MSLLYRVLHRNYHCFQNITKPLKWSSKINFTRILSSNICYQNNLSERTFVKNEIKLLSLPLRQYSTQPPQGNTNISQPHDPAKKPGLVQRFKQMYKDYWYVLLPVHMTTSVVWFGGFYYCVRSGVDVIHVLETVGVSDKLLSPLKESGAGYFALALACYKLVTPLRYAATVGGTTYAINKLTAIGWIKPVPSKERIKEMFQEKRENIQDKFNESKQHYQTQIKEKSTHVMDEMRRYKTEMRNIKNKAKKM